MWDVAPIQSEHEIQTYIYKYIYKANMEVKQINLRILQEVWK